jgi:hypothetical protein
MFVSFVSKNIELNVNGKAKRERKPKFTNADLPFPSDSFAADLKCWQGTLVPELIEWVATLEDPFAANSHPDFRPSILDLWMGNFGAYAITDPVYTQVRSDFLP